MLYQRVRRPFWRRHPWAAGAGVLALCWLLLNGWYTTATLAMAVVLLIAIRRHRRAKELRDAGLRARADYEHRLSLAGDPRGIFGRYPPVQPGWFADPQNHCRIRYFDGATWTPYAVPR
ncbi:DUF2510 domain-containing protein [Mycobacterium hubeiense]|uniref:DUF2510 domain-containing protein n=1 Tax=Mycobacterium hubeiense TaxID=1867256 RepID=UPI000C7E90AA|nr:DUF2510 domain-containing protein [Mycobacterium sp. QGD 101]